MEVKAGFAQYSKSLSAEAAQMRSKVLGEETYERLRDEIINLKIQERA